MMKNSFSLMEVLISTVLLSTTLLAMYEIKSNNIFLVEKSKENKKQADYLVLAIDSNAFSNRNKNLFLDNELNISDDEIRRDLKEIKVVLKEETFESTNYEVENFSFNINTYKSNYSIEDSISKDIIRFKIEL